MQYWWQLISESNRPARDEAPSSLEGILGLALILVVIAAMVTLPLLSAR